MNNKKLLIIEFEQYDEERYYFEKRIFKIGHSYGGDKTMYYIFRHSCSSIPVKWVCITMDFFFMLSELKKINENLFELYIENYLLENDCLK